MKTWYCCNLPRCFILDFLVQEREMMLAHFQELKGQMNKLREQERERLTKLTLESNAAIKELKRKAEKVTIPF